MKKYLIPTFLLLAGCAKPYDCVQATKPIGKIPEGGAFCVSNTDYEYMVENKYTKERFNNLVELVSENHVNGAKCTNTHNKPTIIESSLLYKDTGEKIPNNKTILKCETGTVNAYEKEEQLRLEAEEERAEQQKEKDKCNKLLKKNPGLRKKIKYGVRESYKAAINSGPTEMKQNFVNKVSECMACVFDEMRGESIACSVAESGDTYEIKGAATAIMYQFSYKCEQYHLKQHSFDPCKWAKKVEKGE